VHEALELRFAGLPGAAAAALRTAAVIASGSPRTWSPWCPAPLAPSGTVVYTVAEALAAAVRAQVVSRDGTGTFRFAHDRSARTARPARRLRPNGPGSHLAGSGQALRGPAGQ
jgi:hypothetical protein